jgi:hypothetical protein
MFLLVVGEELEAVIAPVGQAGNRAIGKRGEFGGEVASHKGTQSKAEEGPMAYHHCVPSMPLGDLPQDSFPPLANLESALASGNYVIGIP